MATINAGRDLPLHENKPYHERYTHAPHFRSKADEFDAAKLGMWLFLATEVLLFAGMFCAYAIFRMLYPESFAAGSGYLDWKWGAANTVILLVSSFTVAMSIRNAQLNQQKWLRINLLITMICAIAFVAIKLTFEYTPKWSGYFFFLDPALHHYEAAIDHSKDVLGGLFQFVDGYGGKRPGSYFRYAFAQHPHEPIWWGVYYISTAIHATHVLVGVALLGWLFLRSLKNHFGPNHYTAVEIVGLYWHIVDIIWIFLFPLLYLIH